MTERITRANVDERCANVNRRMESRGSLIRYTVEGRNGHLGLDRMTKDDPADKRERYTIQSTVTVGTKREVAEFLHAMMVALDDSAHTA
jgi:hypothetical protein